MPAEAIAALERGELIAAIKLVREHTGLGLKESKEAVERYQSGGMHAFETLVAPETHPQPTGITLPTEAIAAIRRGEKLEAVKLVRDANKSLGLAQAKDVVEAYAEQRSPSSAMLHDGFTNSSLPSRISGISEISETLQTSMMQDPMAEPGRVAIGQWRPSLFWIAVVLLAVFGVWSLLNRL